MHPAYDGLASLPYYDEFDLSTVDVLLISQYVLNRSFPQEYCPLHGKFAAHRLADYKWPLLSGRQLWNIVSHRGGGLLLQASFETGLSYLLACNKTHTMYIRRNQYQHDQHRAQFAVSAVT